MRLIMWDVDRTLIGGARIGFEAFVAAFSEVTGRPWEAAVDASGRTDSWITAASYAGHGIVEDVARRPEFFDRYAREFAARSHLLGDQAVVLPGVVDALTALAGRAEVVQTLVTGNIRPVGIGTVTALGLVAHLDVEVGGYGDEHADRPELVRRSRARAEVAYGRFADDDVLVVGDTTHDVHAALSNGVLAVGVATGRTSAADLRAAGAHHVFDDLAGTGAVLAVLAGGGPDRHG